MKVTANFHGHLRSTLGTTRQEFGLPEGSTLQSLICEIGVLYGDKVKASLGPWSEGEFVMLILVNGQDQHFLGGLETQLKDGDDIDFMPPMSGG